MLFDDACLSPSAPPHRRRNRNRVALPQLSARPSDRLIPSPRSTPTLRSATNCSPKRRRFAQRRSSRAQLWRMILCKDASNRRARPTRLSLYPKQTPFWNANAARPCEIESRSSAVRQSSAILVIASPTPVRLAPRTLIAAPQHRDARRQTAAHIEGEITFCVWNLPLSGLFGQMLIRFNNLPHAGRSDRMAVAD